MSPAPPPVPVSDVPGTLVAGRYELLRLAGSGGMATVWKAMTRGAAGFARPVAVKRLRPPMAQNPEFVTMFVEEARVASALHHPHVVQIHDFGVDTAGDHFLVMEWVEGIDLQQWAHSYTWLGEPTPWPIVAGVGIEVLKALQAAHFNEIDGQPVPIFHRDVTPHNILLSMDGISKLADFGLARAMDRARITRPNIAKGKLAYMAPELTYGADPSIQSELFSVGVVLWEALAGKKLFVGEDMVQVAHQLREGDVSELSTLRSDVPAALQAILYRALAKDPEHRFATAGDMAKALARQLRTLAHPVDASEVGKTVRRSIKLRSHESGPIERLESAEMIPIDWDSTESVPVGREEEAIPLVTRKTRV